MTALHEQHSRWAQAHSRLMSGYGRRVEVEAEPLRVVYAEVQPPPAVLPQPIVSPVVAHFAWEGGPKIVPIREARWKTIMREVSAKHSIPARILVSDVRDVKSVAARHELFYRLRTELGLSFPEIGSKCGGRDHTTVLHGYRKHKERLREKAVETVDSELFDVQMSAAPNQGEYNGNHA